MSSPVCNVEGSVVAGDIAGVVSLIDNELLATSVPGDKQFTKCLCSLASSCWRSWKRVPFAKEDSLSNVKG